MENVDVKRISQFLFEVGTMRKIARMHRQTLFTDDMSDNIATHSFRAAVIGYFLAKMEGVDWMKVMIMCLIHDMPEARSNDHNWIHKRYVSEDVELIIREQFGELPFSDLFALAQEYEERATREAVLAKDADRLDQILLLREYEWQGNKEALRWLSGKSRRRPYAYLDHLQTETAKRLGKAIYDEEPSSWWTNLYTSKRRSS